MKSEIIKVEGWSKKERKEKRRKDVENEIEIKGRIEEEKKKRRKILK